MDINNVYWSNLSGDEKDFFDKLASNNDSLFSSKTSKFIKQLEEELSWYDEKIEKDDLEDFRDNEPSGLNKDKYIISEGLHRLIETKRSLPENPKGIDKKSQGRDVIVFNVMKNVVVYNDINDNSIFKDGLFYYILTEASFNTAKYNSAVTHDYLFLMDSEFKQDLLSKFFDLDRFGDNGTRWNKFYISNIISLYKKIFCGLPAIYDYKDMADHLNDTIETNYSNIFWKFKKPSSDIFPNDKIGQTDITQKFTLGCLNRNIFIVNDLDKFIKCISNSGRGVNQGSQKWRAQSDSLMNTISNFDHFFRSAIDRHNLYHLINKNIGTNCYLKSRCFSSKNINIKLGNVRWVSTSSRYNFGNEVLNNGLMSSNRFSINRYISFLTNKLICVNEKKNLVYFSSFSGLNNKYSLAGRYQDFIHS